jgi:hypothetical protein
MAKRIRFSPQFKEQLIAFYKENPEASHEEAQKRAKELGYEKFSKSMHDELQRRAAGDFVVPAQCVMDLKTGIFKRLESVTAGDRVAIFELKRRARIEMIDE